MAIEGNSHKGKETEALAKKPKSLKPVANGVVDKKKPSVLEKWLSRDGDTIRDFIIETIVIPGLIDGISGIGDIIIDSFTDGISKIFENKGFLAKSGRSKSSSTSYSSISKKKKRRRRDDYDEDDYDEEDELRYDNIRVRTEREARNVIEELKDAIADEDYGYTTVANLYELTGNGDLVCSTDHRYGWTKLAHPTEDYYTRTRDRERPWLLKLPRPKDLENF